MNEQMKQQIAEQGLVLIEFGYNTERVFPTSQAGLVGQAIAALGSGIRVETNGYEKDTRVLDKTDADEVLGTIKFYSPASRLVQEFVEVQTEVQFAALDKAKAATSEQQKARWKAEDETRTAKEEAATAKAEAETLKATLATLASVPTCKRDVPVEPTVSATPSAT